jgi:hypothetical protein
MIGGVLLALAVLSDVFRSVVLPRPSNRFLRLGPAMGSVTWPGWRWLAQHLPRFLRDGFLGAYPGLLLILELLIWTGLLAIAFGLLLWAGRESFAPPLATLPDAIYEAASAMLTLGVAPNQATGSARWVVSLAGLAGLGLVTLLVTFLLSLVEALQERDAMLTLAGAHMGWPPSAARLLATYGTDHRSQLLASELRAWENWLAQMANSHRTYPMLAYCRSAPDVSDWVAVTGAVLDAASLLIAFGAPSEARGAAGLLHATGAEAVRGIAHVLHVRGAPDDGVRDAIDARETLRAAGWEVSDQTEVARYRALRAAYAGDLKALGRHLGMRSADDPKPAVPIS